jgi:hypothetical protein
MNRHRQRLFFCVLWLLASAAACSQTPEVPEDAKLLYYGPVSTPNQISDILPLDPQDPPRQVYVYDDSTHGVVAVRTVDAHHRDLNFTWILGHQYRVYLD